MLRRFDCRAHMPSVTPVHTALRLDMVCAGLISASYHFPGHPCLMLDAHMLLQAKCWLQTSRSPPLDDVSLASVEGVSVATDVAWHLIEQIWPIKPGIHQLAWRWQVVVEGVVHRQIIAMCGSVLFSRAFVNNNLIVRICLSIKPLLEG